MKTIRNSIFAVLTIACATAVATPGADVAVTDGGYGIAIAQAEGAPIGAYVEAVVDVDGATYVVDAAPVADWSGQAVVVFPPCGRNHRVVLRGRFGHFLTMAGYGGITEND